MELPKTFTLMSGAAMAQQYPEQLKKVDEALAKNPKVLAEQLADARKQRSMGESLQKEGKQAEYMGPPRR